jgi:hypothetical protein
LKVRGIVVHVSASTWGDAKAIRSWHVEGNGWADIGYHGVILNGVRTYRAAYAVALDGKIEPGRPEGQQGAHCKAGGMNAVSLGVCCVGNPGWPVTDAEGKAVAEAPADVRVRRYLTLRQYGALVHWLAANCRQYGLDPLGTFTHPATGKVIPVITQHSDHDRGKPFCASLRLGPVRAAVAAKMEDS